MIAAKLKKFWGEHAGTVKAIGTAVKYLDHYGYLPEKSSVANIVKAVRAFQRFVGHLKADGVIGEKTLAVMSKPRCGCPDMIRGRRRKQPSGSKSNPWTGWGVTSIKWGFAEFLDGINRDDQLDLANQAIDSWKEVTGLKAEYVSDYRQAHVQIGRADRRRGSDGRGNMLAYTYLPTMKPPIPLLFDISEQFVAEHLGGSAIWYLPVFCHEWGHVGMNLEHSSPSDRRRSLLDPFYDPQLSVPQEEDIERGCITWPPASDEVANTPEKPEDYTLRFRSGRLEVEGYSLVRKR